MWRKLLVWLLPPTKGKKMLPPFKAITHSGNTGGEVVHRNATEPVTGYRYWLITRNADGYAFRSLHVPYAWRPGLNRAECLAGGNHPAPDNDHSCGLYAERADKPLGEWQKQVDGRISGSGSILMGGKIIKGANGFKAEWALIESPVVLDAKCAARTGYVTVLCSETPTHAGFADGIARAYCPDHAEVAPEAELIDDWLRDVSAALSEKYDIVVDTWRQL